MEAGFTPWMALFAAAGTGLVTLVPVLFAWAWLTRRFTSLGAMVFAMMARMVVSLGACGLVWRSFGEQPAQRFAIGLLVTYPLYLGFETWWALRDIPQRQRNAGGQRNAGVTPSDKAFSATPSV